MSRKKGFSLIELLIVVAVIATLTGGSFLSYEDIFQQSALNGRRHNQATIRKAIDSFYADNDRYPNSLNELVSHRYLRQIPIDPVSMSAEGWQIIPSKAAANDVYDILPEERMN